MLEPDMCALQESFYAQYINPLHRLHVIFIAYSCFLGPNSFVAPAGFVFCLKVLPVWFK